MGDFTMPSLGADMEAGTLVEWRIKPGQTVKRGDIVAVVETQKGAIEVEVFEDGRVEALLVEPGTRVPVGTVLARIDGAAVAPIAPAASPPSPPAPPSLPPTQAARPAGQEGQNLEERPRSSPAARVLARELGVPLESVRGTGPSGAITREDVERTARGPGPRRPGMRQAIAAAMSRSKREIPHYYLSTRIEIAGLLEWLGRYNEPRKPAERALVLAPLLKAVALAVRKVPEMNGYYEAGAFRPGGGVHLGIAISVREGGLLVPALKDVATKPLELVARELSELIERTRRGQLRSSELTDATLTVTNLGDRGVEEVFGVIYPPQVAIVGFGKVVDSPWVVDGKCVIRPVLVASLAADHRVSDGHRGGLFLAEIAALLQHPEAL